MIKIYKIVFAAYICFLFVISTPSLCAAVDLPWFTTYNCPEWDQSQGNPSCDGLVKAGDWTCSGINEQITSDANYPNGAGGKGQRHWEGDGININSGGLGVRFDAPQKELWIRWYMRYEEGFKWSSLNYDKWLYIHTNVSGCDVIPELVWANGIGAIAQGSPDYYQVYNANRGWQYIYGTESDGSWFCVEVHLKMDTNSKDGVGELWLNGELVASSYAVDYSRGNTTARQGWVSFGIGSNQRSPNNGRPMYVDFDDFYVTNTRPSNKDANGNYFIGPLDSDSFPPVSPPPSEPSVILRETWEQNNVNNWKYDYIAGDTRIDTNPVYAGNYALKMMSSSPGNYAHFFGDHPQLSQPEEMVTDVTVEEYYYLPAGFQWPTAALKLWIMNCFESWNAGYNLATGKSKPHTWAPYYMTIAVDSSGRPFGELVRADGLGGTGALWQAYWQNIGSAVSLVPGKWNKIKYRLKLNDPGKNNGVFQLWVNDVLKCDYSTMNFRGTYTSYGWNHLIMSMHANPSHPQNQWISRDNIRILSGQQISIPPNPPTGVKAQVAQ